MELPAQRRCRNSRGIKCSFSESSCRTQADSNRSESILQRGTCKENCNSCSSTYSCSKIKFKRHRGRMQCWPSKKTQFASRPVVAQLKLGAASVRAGSTRLVQVKGIGKPPNVKRDQWASCSFQFVHFVSAVYGSITELRERTQIQEDPLFSMGEVYLIGSHT